VLSLWRTAAMGRVGGRNAECNIGAMIWIEDHWWELRYSHPRLRCVKMGVYSAEWNRRSPIQTERIKECLSQQRSAERGEIVYRMV